MVSSKLKNDSKKNNLNFDNVTIDAKHNEVIEKFNYDKNLIPKLKKELNELIDEYKLSKNNSLKNNSEYIIERSIKKDNIYKLKNKINKIINNEEINSYYLNVGNLLHEYYKNVDSSTNDEKHNQHIEDFEENLLNYDIDTENTSKKTQNSVIDFFNNRVKDNSDINEKDNDNENENNYTSMKISDFIQEESKFKKKNFLEDYLKKTDPNYITTLKVDNSIFKCKLCNNEMTLYPSDGLQICTECGHQEYILIESDKPSFKDPPLEVCYFSYKRINHFNEWLAQFQAKESTEIPEEVYEKIIAEIKKERITNLEKLDTKKIRAYLKKNKLNKFYDHAAHILYQINGISPPHMSKELEEKLRLMFKEIQGPFMEVCPKWRKNF